ncbi:hypothetical protein RUS47_00770 [Mycoplasmoides gallisepticum]|uniref:Uncharacterized protein n=5 Tax=Mycoplasmoides gallisepticum TaxID=2096 RepID=Q7NBW5_MYCGA|nr:hypothetical protein [Mycoplasmoides gallisepticum]AAP56495.2 unique hypothetical protein [Mycoplasmoides gallisepticum str. R(low)]ADC30328.1 hypothetical protein MGAH_0871 [Mycoplasmoides gallisepticum str. R(high)]ADC31092.1 hypothetical protein MGF_1043 [Mycoplasmoides gallisepticum str. F]AFP75780.1 hypothetical protein HFMG94VAA_1062 [Mycoplasmoides gallisepticum VA94_7994-1-7P]AFP76547.1 hypothetical protein HFMG95NCA_1062 [Mycoplasmoides gallisepticum NC95_13295-2-2P]
MARRDKGINLIILIVLLILGIVPGILYALFKFFVPPFSWVIFAILLLLFVFPAIIYLLTCSDVVVFSRI